MEKGYYLDNKTVDQYIQMAKDVSGQELINQLSQYLPSASTVLEIGSGPGTDWQILNKQYQVTGSDYSPEFLKRLKAQFPDGDFIPLDARNFNISKTFDALYANKVLIHLTSDELQKSIPQQLKSLNTDGLICYSFWKGEGTEIYNGLMIQYQSKDSLDALFSPHFEILLLEEYAEFEEGDSLLFIGRKKA